MNKKKIAFIASGVLAIVVLLSLFFGFYRQSPSNLLADSDQQKKEKTVSESHDGSEKIEELLNKTGSYGLMSLGEKKAPIRVFAYLSFTCPHCIDFLKNSFQKLKSDYIDTGKVSFVLKLLTTDNLATAVTFIPYCSGKERFFKFVDILAQESDSWMKDPKSTLENIAEKGGIDFESCLKNEDIFNHLTVMRDVALKDLGIDATPTFFINNEKLQVGDRDGLFLAIDKKLKKLEN